MERWNQGGRLAIAVIPGIGDGDLQDIFLNRLTLLRIRARRSVYRGGAIC
jgi:hypothetical protein